LIKIKARSSYFIGLWWRLGLRLNALSQGRRALLGTLLFFLYVILVIAFEDRASKGAELFHLLFWGAFLYLAVGQNLFQQNLGRELKTVHLDKDL
jgi:hypothetical protein